MYHYLLRRFLLIPITLFFIVLVNFVIINLAPGEPVSITGVGKGAEQRKQQGVAFAMDDPYLQFREFYGLTYPILINLWPWIELKDVKQAVFQLTEKKWNKGDKDLIPFKQYTNLRIRWGDKARYVMKDLLTIMKTASRKEAITANHLFIRGSYRLAILGPNLTKDQKRYNQKVIETNNKMLKLWLDEKDPLEKVQQVTLELEKWYQKNKNWYRFEPDLKEKITILFFQTRFAKYFGRVLHLDFGTLRNDPNKTVIKEVTKRFKYSLTLSVIPMFLTFFLCQIFGFTMAYYHQRWVDYSLNLFFLVLYAVPVFVVAPFLIEKVALNNTFPFTDIPIPYSGFTSVKDIYEQKTSLGKLLDIMQHIALPITAIMYGSLAFQSRLSRTAVLEVLKQDYIKTAYAKGLSPLTVLTRHVGKNASITIITSIAGSLGILLGGSLIVETIFEINGFGKFFYDAVINRDYNVIMFSVISGSFLTLLGYLIADIFYMILDPRVSLE